MKKIKVITVYNQDLNFVVDVPEEAQITYGGSSISPYRVLDEVLNHYMANAYADWCNENNYSNYDLQFEELY